MNWKVNEIVWEKESVVEYMKKREQILIDEDFVVKDYHVNKKHGLAKFGNVGSLVTNEDLKLLGENGEKYRKF